jgi:hypothetical protein
MKADDQGATGPTLSENQATVAKVGMVALPIDSLESVGRRLRSAYDSTLREPLPVRLTDLLERIGERERCRADDLSP